MYQGSGAYPPGEGYGDRFKTIYREDPPPDYGGFREPDLKDDVSNASMDTMGKEKSFKRLVVRFAEKTSMQGVGYINSAKFWYSKLLWTFLLVGCTVGMSLHLYYLISQFIVWPIQTKIELGFDNLNFPAVTICNVNPIRKSQQNLASEKLKNLLEEVDKLNTQDNPDEKRRRKKRFVDEISKVNTTSFQDYESYYDYDGEEFSLGTEVDPRVQLQNLFTELYREENRDTKIEMGHHIEQMLISCTIGKFKCYASNFTLLQHEMYGNCYTLQFDKLKISKSGHRNGLTVIMYMDKEEYLTQFNEGYGARLLIHDLKSYPFPDEEGIFIPSSAETQIGIRRVVIQRKGKPYGVCTGDIYSARYGFIYTRALCQTLCLQENIFRKCGCYQDDNNELNWQINNKNLKYCTTREEVKCMSKEQLNYDRNKAACVCSNPCRENQFVKTISHRNWPSDSFMFTLKDGVCDRIPSQCADAESLYNQTDDYKKGLNYVKFNIYYEDLNYEKIEETPEIEPAQFASDVGGAVGLWIGLSFLSMFEVMQLCLECCAFAVHKSKNGKKRKRKKKNKNKEERNMTKQNPYTLDSEFQKSLTPRHDNPTRKNSNRQNGVYGGSHMYDYINDNV